MKTAPAKLKELMDAYGETATLAGITVEIKAGSFVIDSECDAPLCVAGGESLAKLTQAFISVARRQTEEYKGYIIEPKLDFGEYPYLVNGATYKAGWVVVKGGCNAMPGATWFRLRKQARKAIDALIESDGDTDRFWRLMEEA